MMKASLMTKSHQVFHFHPIQTKIPPKSSSFTHKPPCYAKLVRKPGTKYAVVKQSPHDPPPLSSSLSSLSSSLNEAKENGFLGRSLVVTGAVGIAVLLLMGNDKALAFGPEGPLVEEFWENVRRYALYALTVSTGVLYAVLQPIFELLKNPISAILVVVIIGGTIFIISQVLSAMVGVSEFAYQYSY